MDFEFDRQERGLSPTSTSTHTDIVLISASGVSGGLFLWMTFLTFAFIPFFLCHRDGLLQPGFVWLVEYSTYSRYRHESRVRLVLLQLVLCRSCLVSESVRATLRATHRTLTLTLTLRRSVSGRSRDALCMAPGESHCCAPFPSFLDLDLDLCLLFLRFLLWSSQLTG